MHYVVVGAGPAGVNAVETLRSLDPTGSITLLGGEAEAAYSRMAIPYLLSGDIDEAGTRLRHAPDHFSRLGIDCRHDRVTDVDSNAHRVHLASGGWLDFDRLLLATGSRPIRPPIPGLDRPGVHHCWTLEDARHIQRLAGPKRQVVLIGAGFIGCIILEALVARGVCLTVLEMGEQMVPRMLDKTAGELLARWCRSKGVAVHTGVRVTEIGARSAGPSLEVVLDLGEPLAADMVVIAAGVRPNTDFLDGSPVTVDAGILVDHNLRTSAEDIYAAGDCCQGLDWSSGQRSVHAIQPTATEHGRVAALNMAGISTPYAGSLNMNVLDTLGLISTSYGLWMGHPGGDAAVRLKKDAYRYLKLQFAEDRLVGAITLGHTDSVGVLRGMIQSRIRLGTWKDRLLDDPSRYLEAYVARTQMPQQ
jgi:NAD(P)H-nitrite reductase large subunit